MEYRGLSVCHNHEPCKNGWADWGVVWDPEFRLVLSPAVGCLCFLSGMRLSSQPQSFTALASTNFCCLVNRAMCVNDLPWVPHDSRMVMDQMRDVGAVPCLLCYHATLVRYSTTVLRPLYRTICISQHPQFIIGGFCWSKVLLPACPWWRQLAHPITEKTLEFSLTMLLYCTSAYSSVVRYSTEL